MFCSARQKSCPIVSVRPSETHVSHLHARIHLSASITAAPNIYSSHSPPCLSSGWIGADRLTTEIPKTLSLYPCPCFVAYSKLSSAIDSVSSTTFSTPVSMGVAVDKPAGRIVFLVVRSNSASDIHLQKVQKCFQFIGPVRNSGVFLCQWTACRHRHTPSA